MNGFCIEQVKQDRKRDGKCLHKRWWLWSKTWLRKRSEGSKEQVSAECDGNGKLILDHKIKAKRQFSTQFLVHTQSAHTIEKKFKH